jgi:hypothetical protein
VADDGDAKPPRRRVRRGEGEVTQWPRGWVDYVPAGPPDRTPSPDDDRTANRLALVARILALLRARGDDVEREVAELREAEALLARGDRTQAGTRVDRLLAALDERAPDVPPAAETS